MQGSLIYTSNLYVFTHKTSGKEAASKSPEWVSDFTAVQLSKMVRQHTWHNVWNSTLSAICLNYHSSCIVRERRCASMNMHYREEKAARASQGIYVSVIVALSSQFHIIATGTHMKMCVRWRMSTVIACGCDIRQVLWVYASPQR